MGVRACVRARARAVVYHLTSFSSSKALNYKSASVTITLAVPCYGSVTRCYDLYS